MIGSVLWEGIPLQRNQIKSIIACIRRDWFWGAHMMMYSSLTGVRESALKL